MEVIKLNREKTDKIVDFLRAIANPVRVEIIKQLLKGEKCVTDIKKISDSTQPNISQHLTILRLNGIVECEREGHFKCYKLKNPEEVRKILDIVEKIV